MPAMRLWPLSTLLVDRNDRLIHQVRDRACHILLTFSFFRPSFHFFSSSATCFSIP